MVSFLFVRHLKWWKRIFDKEVSLRKGLDEKQWQLLLDASVSEVDFVRVAQIDGNAVGIIWARVKNEEWLDCCIGQLNWIAVAPDVRRHGVGTKLLQEADIWFASKQISQKFLYVAEQNMPAIDLYKKFGYTITDYRMLGKVEPTHIPDIS